jgi:hypothetical protein
MHCYQSSHIFSGHKTTSVEEAKSKPSIFQPCATWAKNMASKYPFTSGIVGIFAFALAAVLVIVATTQIRRWSRIHRKMSLQLLGNATHPCEEKALLATEE